MLYFFLKIYVFCFFFSYFVELLVWCGGLQLETKPLREKVARTLAQGPTAAYIR